MADQLNGWIALHRKFEQWGWYGDPITKAVFIDLLITANWKDTEYRGVLIKRGQTVIGRKALAAKLGISEKQVRTALSHLEKSGEIRKQATNRFTIVTLCKFNDYQSIEKDERPTEDQQRANRGPHLNNITNNNINKSIYISELVAYLNKKSGKNYRITNAAARAIGELEVSGYTMDQCKRVVDLMVEKWKGTKYEPGLAPKSLFAIDNFDSYLNEVGSSVNRGTLAREYAYLQIKYNEIGLTAEEEVRMNQLAEEFSNDY